MMGEKQKKKKKNLVTKIKQKQSSKGGRERWRKTRDCWPANFNLTATEHILTSNTVSATKYTQNKFLLTLND